MASYPIDPRITVDLIRQRSNDDAGCWIWASSVMRGKHPTIRGGNNRQFMARRCAWMLSNDADIPPGFVIVSRRCVCESGRCVNPAHLECISQAESRIRTNQSGVYANPIFSARVAAGRRGANKLTPEACADIIAGHDSTAEAAARHGISRGYVRMLRRGAFVRNTQQQAAATAMGDAANNPFGGLVHALLRA